MCKAQAEGAVFLTVERKTIWVLTTKGTVDSARGELREGFELPTRVCIGVNRGRC